MLYIWITNNISYKAILPRFVRADNDSLRLLIIDVRLLIKYNALKNHVIFISMHY